MLLRSIDLTTALRPELSAGETLLFVQDGVGLYQGYVVLVAYLPIFGNFEMRVC